MTKSYHGKSKTEEEKRAVYTASTHNHGGILPFSSMNYNSAGKNL